MSGGREGDEGDDNSNSEFTSCKQFVVLVSDFVEKRELSVGIGILQSFCRN
jgi:hypothetical protein